MKKFLMSLRGFRKLGDLSNTLAFTVGPPNVRLQQLQRATITLLKDN